MKTLLAIFIPVSICLVVDYFNLWEWIFGFTVYGGLTMCVVMPFASMFNDHA